MVNNLIGFSNFTLYPNQHPLRRAFSPLKIFENVYDRFDKLDINLYRDYINFHYNLDAKCKSSFEDICLNRANELARQSDKIFLCLSGGIDSTTVLSSFYLTGNINKCIVITDEQELENRDILLPWLKKNNVPVLFFDENNAGFVETIINNTEKNEKYIITNGNNGDQIDHGPMFAEQKLMMNNVDLNTPWKDFFKDNKDTILELEKYLSKYDFGDKIQKIKHLSFLFNFSIRWTLWETSSIFFYHQLPPIVHQTFFSTQEFTDWTINNLDFILQENQQWNDKLYKRRFKKVISKVFGNAFDAYGKVFSFGKVMPKMFNKKIFATDGVNLYGLDFVKKSQDDLEKGI